MKLITLLTPTFILFTAIGTVTHECGHLVAARALGYDATIHYASTSYGRSSGEVANFAKASRDAYDQGVSKSKSDQLLIVAGGPLQTMLTGIIGLTILLWRKRSRSGNRLTRFDWFAVFLALFWLREVFNLTMSVSSGIIASSGSYFSGDEKKISVLLGLWEGTMSCSLGAIGLMVALYIICAVIPARLRLTFILSGVVGGVVGYVLWMEVVGPVVLP